MGTKKVSILNKVLSTLLIVSLLYTGVSAALTPRISNVAANAAADAICALGNGGFLDIYDSTGTGQPATADTAITTQVKLAGLTLNATACGAAVAGVATFNAIGSDASADATGTATWFRVYKSDHTTVVFDGSVGTSGANINLSSTSIVATGTVSVSSLTFTQSKS